MKEKKEYIGTYEMPNGTFFEVYKDEDGNMFDQNNVSINNEELSNYKKINERFLGPSDAVIADSKAKGLYIEEDEKSVNISNEDLPDMCYTYVYTDQAVGIVKKYVMGYFKTNVDLSKIPADERDEWGENYVREQNKILGVTEEEQMIMTGRSMFGWDNKKESLEETKIEPEINLNVDVNIPVWIRGTIKIDDTEYEVQAKVFLEGSEFGIDNGPISKLTIKNLNNKNTIVNFDRGWDIKPKSKEDKEVYEEIVKIVEAFRNKNPYKVDENKNLTESVDQDKLDFVLSWVSDHIADDDIPTFCADCGITEDEWESQNYDKSKEEDIYQTALDWIAYHIHEDDVKDFEDRSGIKLFEDKEESSDNMDKDNIIKDIKACTSEEQLEDVLANLSNETLSDVLLDNLYDLKSEMDDNGGDFNYMNTYIENLCNVVEDYFDDPEEYEAELDESKQNKKIESINSDGFSNDEELQKYFQDLGDLPDEVEIDGIKYKMEQYGGSGDNAYVIYTDINNEDSYIKVFYSLNKTEKDNYKGIKEIKGVSDLRENKKITESNKEDIEDDLANIEEFLNNTDGYATPEAEAILQKLKDKFDQLTKKYTKKEESKSEEYSFQEIINMMENAEDYSELYSAADLIKDEDLRNDVISILTDCEEDEDPVDVAYSVVTSDLLDDKIADLNESKCVKNESITNDVNIQDNIIKQLKEMGMDESQAIKTYKALLNIFINNMENKKATESVESDNLMELIKNLDIQKVSDIFTRMKRDGWKGDIEKIKDYFDKALAKVEESKKLNESNAEDFIKDVEDAKLLGWDGKDETFKDYMKKVNDMRQVNKELKRENNEADKIDLSKVNLKDMYMKTFPEDSFLFDDLRDDTTVQDVIDALNKGEDIYQVIFGDQGGDSVVRENIFGYLADTLNVDYKDIYDLWLHPEKSKKLQEAEETESDKLEENKFDKCQATLPLDNYHSIGIIVSEDGSSVQYMYSNDEEAVYESEIEYDEEGNPFFKDESGQIWNINEFMRTNFNESKTLTEEDEDKDEDKEEIKNTETEEERDKRIFDELANSEESKTTLDLLQDRIGQPLSVGEFNTILQSIFAKYNEVFLLTNDLYDMDPNENQELVIFDDDDMYTINYDIKDIYDGTIEITDVNIE